MNVNEYIYVFWNQHAADLEAESYIVQRRLSMIEYISLKHAPPP